MADIELQGLVPIREMLRVGITKPLERSVTLIANNIRTKTILNAQRVIYSRKVEWKRTRALLQSIATEKLSALESKVKVGVEYGKFVEYGTRQHTIYPKGKYLSFFVNNKKIFAKKVVHHGSKAYPFFNPAIKDTKTEIPAILQAEIARVIKLKSV